MAIRVFEAATEANVQIRGKSELVGRARAGHQVNRRPVSLSHWRFTMGDPDVAERVREILGGDPATEWETTTDEKLEVFTTSKSMDVVLDRIKSGMVLWGRSGKIRSCDGITMDGDGTPGGGGECQCPSDLNELKRASKAGTACEPSSQFYFRLAEDPGLGTFAFYTSSWGVARDVSDWEQKLEELGGPAEATMSLERVEFTTKDGEARAFTRMNLAIHGPAKVLEPSF